ncbi:nucleotidyltransferase domain-containing protein [Marispirochaeta aestuarii]|uniref:nucleotidyltransferase domain-containing protein n=1 Tax=Marispirochaeta aestuarii TaxID=1963862 RepID=UPI0029C8405E|nr:nucleotidyltransferase domain-containing protein [Marispirochaeta aestuarii]
MNAVLQYEEYIKQITDALQQIDPYKIILFGSAASGNLHEDSDIDIIVVLSNETIPQTYDEKMKLKLSVRRALREINKRVPIDTLTYTKKEYELILNNKNSFFREVDLTSRIIYEKAS